MSYIRNSSVLFTIMFIWHCKYGNNIWNSQKNYRKMTKSIKTLYWSALTFVPLTIKKYTMEEMELIHKVENGELDMLGYIMLNPELKEPFSDYARGNGITCPTAADAVRFLKEYEERLYQELLP